MNYENTSYFGLWNLLGVYTVVIKICLREKTPKNVRFWQIVRHREQIIEEIRKANEVEFSHD